MSGAPDYETFFHHYAGAYERSLGDRVETGLIRSFFAESFLGASTLGGVSVGANDDAFARTLEQGYAFYGSRSNRCTTAMTG